MTNKHPYLNNEGEHVVGGKKTGFIFSDAVIQANCPKCGSKPGFHCETPQERKTWPPHNQRIKVAADKGLL